MDPAAAEQGPEVFAASVQDADARPEAPRPDHPVGRGCQFGFMSGTRLRVRRVTCEPSTATV